MKIIEDFETAVREHEMKGSMHPDDWATIELKYVATKARLEDYIIRLKEKK